MSGGSLRRPMGFFAPFNTWWSSFFLQHGRRPTKTDIEMWRAGNPTWRPELTLEEIVQHSKGRRDPEKNRQYFVEYRRRRKDCAKRAAKQGKGIERAVPKKLAANEPWEKSTSVENANVAGLESTNEQAAQTSSPRRTQPFRCSSVKPHEQACSSPAPITPGMDCPSADPDAVEATSDTAAAAVRAELADSDTGAANNPNVVYVQNCNRDTSGGGPEVLPEAFSVAASAPPVPFQPGAIVPTRISVQRTRGPMVTTQLRSATAQLQLRGRAVFGVLCQPGNGSSDVLDSFGNLATAVPAVAADASSWASAGPDPVTAPSASCFAKSSNVVLDYLNPGLAANSSGGDAAALPTHLELPPAGFSCAIPEPEGAPCSMVSPPCLVVGRTSDGAEPSWMLMSAPLVENGHRTTGAPPPGAGGASRLDAMAAGVNCLAFGCTVDVASTAGAFTLPFCDHGLHRTCSTGSISTDMVAAASDITDSIAEGWTLPFEIEPPAPEIPLVTGGDARAQFQATTATWHGPYGCAPMEGICALQEPTLSPMKRQSTEFKSRTSGPPSKFKVHPANPDVVTAGLHANSMPLSFDVRHASASLNMEHYQQRCMAVACAWTPGRSADLSSGSGGRQPVSAVPVRDEHQCATSTSHWNMTWGPYNDFGAEQQPQPQQDSDPQGGKAEMEMDLIDASWFDRLFVGSQTEFLFEAPIAEALYGPSTGICGTLSLQDLGGGGDESLWSTSM